MTCLCVRERERERERTDNACNNFITIQTFSQEHTHVCVCVHILYIHTYIHTPITYVFLDIVFVTTWILCLCERLCLSYARKTRLLCVRSTCRKCLTFKHQGRPQEILQASLKERRLFDAKEGAKKHTSCFCDNLFLFTKSLYPSPRLPLSRTHTMTHHVQARQQTDAQLRHSASGKMAKAIRIVQSIPPSENS